MTEVKEYAGQDYDVIVVGAGHAGLSLIHI